MKKNTYLIMTISTIFCCFQCSDDKLKIRNNSSKNITVYYSETDEFKEERLPFFYTHLTNVKLNSTETILARNNTWKSVFSKSDNNIITFYIYDTTILQNQEPNRKRELLKNKKNWLKKYQYNRNDLDMLNWVIVFP